MNTDRSASRIRNLVLFISVTGIHVVTSIVLLFYVFGSGMARFDTGAPERATESIARWVFAVLSFPVLTLLERMPIARFPGLWGYVPVLANASLWGLAAIAIRRWLRARASQRADA